MSLVICFVFVSLRTIKSYSCWRLFAGIAISQTPYQSEISRHIEPLGYTVFIPVFFVSIGLSMTFADLNRHLVFIIVLTVLAVLAKLLGSGWGAKMMGAPPSGCLHNWA